VGLVLRAYNQKRFQANHTQKAVFFWSKSMIRMAQVKCK